MFCIAKCDTEERGDEKGVTYLGDQNLVTGSDAHGKALAILVEGTGADGEDLGLVLLLDTALREEDTGGSLGLGLDALDQDAVQEGGERLDVTEDRLLHEMSVNLRCAKAGCCVVELEVGEKCGGRSRSDQIKGMEFGMVIDNVIYI
jgi:hypothetical protein